MLKIAVVTEEKQVLSNHFGRAPFYQVFSVDDGTVVAVEERAKPHHGEGQHEQGHDHDQHTSHHPHNHADMFAPIGDCQVLLCGGMGSPAFQRAQEAGLEVILTGGEIRTAVEAYLKGEVRSDPRRIHMHHYNQDGS